MSGPIPDDARRYVTSDIDGHLRQNVTRWLALPPDVSTFAAALTWHRSHTFNRIPSVQLFSAAGKEIDATVNATTVDVTVTFSEPVGGTLILQ